MQRKRVKLTNSRRKVRKRSLTPAQRKRFKKTKRVYPKSSAKAAKEYISGSVQTIHSV